jgi:thiol-disulfide isomerase/thioredoxin
MKKLILISVLMFFVQSVFAIEIGDSIPACNNSIQVRLSSGEDTKGCIEDFAGKQFLMIEFMSVFCGSCLRALPVVNKVGVGVKEMVSTRFVTLDRNLEDVINFWNEHSTEISHPFLFDIERTSLRPYKVKYTPTTIVVNKEGVVIYKHVGEFDDSEVDQLRSLFE